MGSLERRYPASALKPQSQDRNCARTDSCTQRQDEVRVAAHVACADNSLCHKQVRPVSTRPLVMRVHVPQTGAQEFAFTVQSGGCPRNADFKSDRFNPPISNQHGEARAMLTTDYVNNRDVGDGDRRCGELGRLLRCTTFVK